MSKISKIKVNGELYSISDLATQDALNSEVERAYAAEESIRAEFDGIRAKSDDNQLRLNELTKTEGDGSIQEQINKSIENKQDKLISGVSIKTVNGKSILGNGEVISDNSIEKNKLSVDVQNSLKKADTAIQDISGKQDTLISGNNIKTVNGLSLVGPGNIDLAALSGSSSADIAPHSSTLRVESTENNTTLLGNTIGGEEILVPIPAATTENAGVMSAEDKDTLNSIFDKEYNSNNSELVPNIFYNLTSKNIGDKIPATSVITGKGVAVFEISARTIVNIKTYTTSNQTGANRGWFTTDKSGYITDMAEAKKTYDYREGVTIQPSVSGYLYVSCNDEYKDIFNVSIKGHLVSDVYAIKASNEVLEEVIRGNNHEDITLYEGFYNLSKETIGSPFPSNMITSTTKLGAKIVVEDSLSIFLKTYVTSTVAGACRAWCVVDKDNTILAIDKGLLTLNYLDGINIELPEKAKYLYIQCDVENRADLYVESKGLVNDSRASRDEIKEKINELGISNHYDKTAFSGLGMYNQSQKNVGDTFNNTVSSNTEKYYGEISLKSFDRMIISTYVTSNTIGYVRPYCFVDANEVILNIPASLSLYDYKEVVVSIPEEAVKVYIACNSDYADEFNVTLSKITEQDKILSNEIAEIKNEAKSVKSTNTPPLYLPNKTVMLSGASISQYNGYFEYAMKKLGLTGSNRSIAGYNILHLCYLLYTNSFIDTDLLIISHIHNYDVSNLPSRLESYTPSQYESDILLSVYLTTNQYVSGTITPPEGYSIDEMYAIGYDYAIKKWAEHCYNAKDAEGYDSLAGKPFQIVLYTYWHDGRTIYNEGIRKLSKKWGLPLIKDDENIGFSKNRKHPITGQQWSILYCNGTPWGSKTEVIDGETYGFHPSGIATTEWSAFKNADADTMLSMLPDIQIRRASILLQLFNGAII